MKKFSVFVFVFFIYVFLYYYVCPCSLHVEKKTDLLSIKEYLREPLIIIGIRGEAIKILGAGVLKPTLTTTLRHTSSW